MIRPISRLLAALSVVVVLPVVHAQEPETAPVEGSGEPVEAAAPEVEPEPTPEPETTPAIEPTPAPEPTPAIEETPALEPTPDEVEADSFDARYPRHIRLILGAQAQLQTGDELDKLTERDVTVQGQYGLGMRVWRHVSVDLVYVSGSTSASPYADTTNTLTWKGMDARVRVDWAGLPLIRVYGVASVGVRDARLESAAVGIVASDRAFAGRGSLGAGAELSYIGERFLVGLFYEVGYAVQSPLNFSEASVTPGAVGTVDLGDVFVHGLVHGGGLFAGVRF